MGGVNVKDACQQIQVSRWRSDGEAKGIPALRVRVKKNARYPALWLDNLNICFKAIDKLKIPHQGIIAKDFMDGREKLVVSFIWRLITTYDLPRSSKMIIKWFNKRIKKFGIAPLDLLDPCPGVVSGVPFAALVE